VSSALLSPPRLTLNGMARRHGVSEVWIATRIRSSTFKPELRSNPAVHGRREYWYYSPDCVGWIDQQVEALMQVPALGKYLTMPQAAEVLGTTHHWVTKAVKIHGLPAHLRRSPTSQLVQAISPRTLGRLRSLRSDIAPHTWGNRTRLMHETGWQWHTIRKRLTAAGLESRQYRTGESGHLCIHYRTAEALQVLGIRPADIAAGGSWMTINALSRRLGRTHKWVAYRLSQAPYKSQRQRRLDDCGRPRWHYPPTVLAQLQRESLQQDPAAT
jgi:hypothetical protein